MMDAQFYFLLRLGIIVTTVSLYNCLNCIQQCVDPRTDLASAMGGAL